MIPDNQALESHVGGGGQSVVPELTRWVDPTSPAGDHHQQQAGQVSFSSCELAGPKQPGSCAGSREDDYAPLIRYVE